MKLIHSARDNKTRKPKIKQQKKLQMQQSSSSLQIV